MRDSGVEETKRHGEDSDGLLGKRPESKAKTTPINGFSSGAFVCAIGGVVSSLMPRGVGLGILLSLLAFVLSAVGLTRPDGKGMAAAGLAISVLNLLFLVLVVAGILSLLQVGA